MRLSKLTGPPVLRESLQTDFFDVYLLASTGQEDSPLMVDRVDQLYEAVLGRAWIGLMEFARNLGMFAGQCRYRSDPTLGVHHTYLPPFNEISDMILT